MSIHTDMKHIEPYTPDPRALRPDTSGCNCETVLINPLDYPGLDLNRVVEEKKLRLANDFGLQGKYVVWMAASGDGGLEIQLWWRPAE